MKYRRHPIEIESPEERGYNTILYNLAESSVSDQPLSKLIKSIPDLSLCYIEHKGNPDLLNCLSFEYGLNVSDFITTPGAAAALFMVHTALLNSGDHVLVVHPNYSTNIETPIAIGCEVEYINLLFENKFTIDTEEIKSKIKPTTKLISITNPHNPTGICFEEETIFALQKIAEDYNLYLLIDETYRDLSRVKMLPLLSKLSEKIISVSSLSKAFGLPGIRIGWISATDRKLQELFLAAKEQIFLCNSAIDEYLAVKAFENKEELLIPIRTQVNANYSYLKKWINNHKLLEWVQPDGGVVCFPRIKPEFISNTSVFYKLLSDEYKTYVGPGHWFDMPDSYFRIGYGWPTPSDFKKGLNAIDIALHKSHGLTKESTDI